MGLKDDFLEALRSVKRDFVGEYKSPDATPTPSAPPAPVERSSADDHTVSGEPARQEEPGETAASFSERPHIRDTFQAQLHTPSELDAPPNAFYDIEKEPAFGEEDHSPSSFAQSAAEGSDEAEGEEPLEDRDGRQFLDSFDIGDPPGDERTIISKNTVIRGALQTDDSVRMFGQVLGDIECRSNILVAGKVRGNTSAANAYVINAQVDGNMLCDDVINVTDDAWILGNIRAQQADIDGKIKGNIEIRHSINIGSNSSVIGNISTDELEIKRGAFVNGQIMMYSPSRDVMDRFDSFGQ